MAKPKIWFEKALFLDWIDRGTIADTVFDQLEASSMRATLENAKKIWLNVLQNGLPDDIKFAIEAIRGGWKP